MSLPFALIMAWRESRRSRARLLLYMTSVSLGVGGLVAINSFSANVSRAVAGQARALLGADLELRSATPFVGRLATLLDSTTQAGASVSRVTSFASMVLAPRTGRTRLFEVRGVEGGFPYYGTITTDPPDLWHSLQANRQVLVDLATLVELDARVGDTLTVGSARFPVAGVITSMPGDVGLRTAMGPRVFLPGRYIAETQLLGFGSRAQYRAFLKFPSEAAVQRFLMEHRAVFDTARIASRTTEDQEEDLNHALGTLARYLGLVSLIALLLGGIGVASAVHVFVQGKLHTAALLRCLGASGRSVLSIYLAQSIALGILGAALGVVLGVAVQSALPSVLQAFLPLDVTVSLSWRAMLGGFAVGGLTAAIFAALPLLTLRDATPLRALRRETAAAARRGADPWRLAVYAALGAGVLAASLWEAPKRGVGLWFAGSIAATTLTLWLTARGLMLGVRRFFPHRAQYVIRQGIANLFRPRNQTVAVILALGFGVFLIATLYVVQYNLMIQFSTDGRPDRPTLVLFDIQPDQKDGVRRFFADRGVRSITFAPIVPARITRIDGRTIAQLRADSSPGMSRRGTLWREYRNTYRDTLAEGEQLVAGQWWSGREGTMSSTQAGPATERVARISVEEDLARALHIRVGSRVTWDVQGVALESEVANIRRVTWARFQPNFFVVFEPGVLDNAPQTFVTLTHVGDPALRATVQRDLVVQYPNIAILDLTAMAQSLDGLLSKVATAIRFMALFSMASGLTILIGALATSRFQRVREAVLLRTLGARNTQIRQIVLTEYFVWGSLAGMVGLLLAGTAAWALTRFVFDMRFSLPWGHMVVAWASVAMLTTMVGWASSGDVLRRTPLAVLREMSD